MSLTVEVALDVAPSAESTSGAWTAVTSYLSGPLTASRGARRGGTGNNTAGFHLDNADRAMSPDTLGSHMLVRHCRILWSGTPVFRGFTQRWRDVWAYNHALIEVRLTDQFARLAQMDADLDLPRQKTGARVNALLDLAGIPAALRDIDDGNVWLEAFEQNGANLRRTLDDTADAEDGQLTLSRDGKIVFRDRHDRLKTTSVIRLRGTAATVAGDFQVAEGLTPTRDTDELVNVARVELADGTVFIAEDTASVAEFDEWDASVRDLALPDYQAEALANWIAYRFAWPNRWMDGLPVDITGDVATGLAVELGDLADFVHAAPGGSEATYSGHVDRIVDQFETGRVLSTFDLSPYFGAGPWFTVDDPVLGVVDAGNLIAP